MTEQSKTIEDGGPAFPLPLEVSPSMSGCGMSLRDYFAAHCNQPGTSEAYQAAGEPEVELPPGWSKTDVEHRAAHWWKGLSLDEKYHWYTYLRYRIADAMLAARRLNANPLPPA